MPEIAAGPLDTRVAEDPHRLENSAVTAPADRGLERPAGDLAGAELAVCPTGRSPV